MGSLVKRLLDNAGLLREASDRIANMEARLEHIMAGGCYVSHPGEWTSECDVQHPCPACLARVAQAKIQDLTVDLSMKSQSLRDAQRDADYLRKDPRLMLSSEMVEDLLRAVEARTLREYVHDSKYALKGPAGYEIPNVKVREVPPVNEVTLTQLREVAALLRAEKRMQDHNERRVERLMEAGRKAFAKKPLWGAGDEDVEVPE